MKETFELWKTLPRAFPYLRPYRRLLLGSFLVTLLGAAFALAEPWPLAIMVDNVLGDRQVTGPVSWVLGDDPAKYSLLALVVVAGFVITFTSHGLIVLTDWVTARLEQQMVLDLRSDMFNHAQGLSLTFHDGRMTGQLMNQINQQAAAMGAIVVAVPPSAQAALPLVGMLVVIAIIDWPVAVVALVAVPFIWWALGLYGKRIVPRVQRVQALEWQSLSIVHEAMAMLRVIVAFGREKHEYKRFRKQGEVAVDERVKLTVRQTLFSLAVTSATALGTGLVLGFGGWRVLQGEITVGELLVLIAYVASVYQPLEQISNTIGDLNDQFVQFNSSIDLLDTEKEVKEAPDAIAIGRARGAVAFEHVNFAYKGRRNTIQDISFAVEAGQRVAIVGPTGAGKTTLISVLIRYYDPKSGRVTIDGHDIRSLTLESLREQISVVLQEPLLFSGTIKENIRYGRLDATDEEVFAAARAANVHEFISTLPDGYDTELGERGAQLSGGERQRISVARAFIKDAPILVLDEPTSSIDSRTEAVILDALDELMVGRTSFMIAHRLSTIRDVDVVLVMKDGRLVEQGTHEELVEIEGGAYRELYEAQNRPRQRRMGGAVSAVASAGGASEAATGAGGNGERPALALVDGTREEPIPEDLEPGPTPPAPPEHEQHPPATPAQPQRRPAARRLGAAAVRGFAALVVLCVLAAFAYVLIRDDDAPPVSERALAARVDSVRLGGMPSGVALARGRAFVTRPRSTRLVQVDLRSFASSRLSHAVPRGATDIAAAAGALWVTSAAPARVTRIDLDTGAATGVRLPGGNPVTIRAHGRDVWAAVRGTRGGALVRIDAERGSVTQIIPLREGVHTLSVDGNAVWATAARTNAVTRVDTRTGRAEVLRTGADPSGVVATRGAAWVANSGDDTVTRIGEGKRWDGPARVPGRPRAIAISRGLLFAAGVDSSLLHAFDLRGGRRAGRPVQLAGRPTKLVADGRTLYAISVAPGARRLQRVVLAPGAEG